MARIADSSLDLFGQDPLDNEIARLRICSHPCFIYEKQLDWRAFICTFIKIGLDRNEKCLYVYDTHTAKQVRDSLKESGLPLNRLESSGQLVVIHGSKVYLKGGSFEPDQMTRFLAEETKRAQAEGYSGLRATGETEWVLQGLPGSAKILEYESKLNRDMIPHCACLMVCQYDRSKYDPTALRNIILAHPFLIHHNRVYKNAYYIPTDLFLSNKKAELESQFLIQNIEREDNRERELSDTVQKLQVIFKEANTVIMVTNEAGKFVDANQPALDFLERSRSELLNSSIWEIILPEYVQQWHRHSSDLGTAQQLEAEFLVKGNFKILMLSLVRVVSDGTKLLYAIGQDITQRRAMEKSLAESEEKIRQLYQTMNEGVAVYEMVYDNEGHPVDYILTDVNPAFETITGMKKEDSLNRRASELFGTSEPPFFGIYSQVAAGGQPFLFESYFPPIRKYFSISVFSPHRGQFTTVFSDITQRKKLEVRNALLASVVQFSEDAILSYDLEGIITSWNKSAEKIYNFDEKEILGKSVSLLVPQERQFEIRKFLEAVKRGEQLERFETIRQKKDGQTFHASLSVSPIMDSLGQIIGASTIARDISERKKYEEALRISEERLRMAQSAAKAGTWEWDLTSNRNIWSPEVWKLYGLESQGREPSYELWRESIHPDDREKADKAVQEAARSGSELNVEWRINNSGTEERWLASRGKPVYRADGTFVRYLGIVMDITEAKRMQQALLQSNNLFSTVANAATSMIWMSGLDKQCTWFNQPWLKFTGRSMTQECGQGWTESVHPDDLERVVDIYTRSFESRQTFSMEYRLKRHDGQYRWILDNGGPMHDVNGRFTGFIGACLDITERIQAEEALKESERFNSSLLQNSPYPIIVTNLDTSVRYVNPAFETLTGYSSQSVIGLKSPYPWWPRKEGARYETENAAGRKLEENVLERTFVKKNGDEVWVELHIQPVKDDKGTRYFLGNWVDITERKKAEQQSLLNEARLESLLRISHYHAPDTQNLLDYALKEALLLTKSKLGYVYLYYEDKKEFILNSWSREVMGNCKVQNPQTIYKLEKTGIWGEAVRQKIPIILNDFQAAHLLKRGLPEGHVPLTKFMTIPVKMDQMVVAVLGVANKESDYDQTDVRQLTLLMDTTWKMVERARLEEEGERAAKILGELYITEREQRKELQEEAKARGMFIDVLAHELRTPLTPILISTSVLKDLSDSGDNSVTKKLADNICASAETLSHRLEELLDVARYSRGTFKLNLQPVDIGKHIEAVIARFKPYLDQHSQILEASVQDNLPVAVIDPSRLEQVLINLLSNASKFSPEKEIITLKAGLLNEELLIEVRDNGIGISAEEQNRLFQPYHRAEQDRQKFPGIGLGLAVVKQIVEAHGGKVWLNSNRGTGSVFSVLIPLKKVDLKSQNGTPLL